MKKASLNAEKQSSGAHEPWPRAKLGEVCEEKVKRIRTLAPKTTIAYIDIGSVCRERKRILTTTQYSVEDAPGRAQQLVQKGDLLVSTVRPNLNAVALVEEDSDLPLVASTGFCVLRAKSGLDSRYAYYFSQTEAFISQLVSVSEKASYPSVTDTVVKGAEIPLPPLSVQRAVVARLEGEMKAVGRLEAGFREMGAAAEAAFAAELAEAFAAGAGAGEERNGRVEHKEPGLVGAGVPARPRGASGGSCVSASAGEPAEGGFFNACAVETRSVSEGRSRSDDERSEATARAREKRENGRRGEGEPWPKAKLGDCLVSLRTGLNPRRFFRLNTPDAKNYYVTIRELKGNSIVFTDRTDRINEEALALCNHRSNLEVGDVLFSGTGTVGVTALVREQPKNWNIKEGVYALKPKSGILDSS